MSSGYEDQGAGRNAGGSGDECVLLTSVYDPVEAQIIVAKLRSAGIMSYLKHEAFGVVYGLTVDGAGQQDIMVRADELEEARAAPETEAVDN